MEQKFFIGAHIDKEIRSKSSSGGAFTAITDEILNKYSDASIYGCILNENLQAVHIRATSKLERNKMRGSKYISSKIVSCYKDVEKDLKDGRYVIFSGTPCQISAIIKYLNIKSINMENLITIEVICHGVGSNKFFYDYIKNLEKKYKGKAIYCNFRSKSKPGKIQDMEVRFDNGKKYNAVSTKFDWFYSIYLKNLILRPSCYTCKFSHEKRNSDISIADAWGIKDKSKNTALSLIIANTEKGMKIVKNITNVLNMTEINKEDVHQPHMHHPCKKPQNYDEFWKIYLNKGYLTAQKYIGNNTSKGRLKLLIIKIINKVGLIKIIKK